MNKLATLVVELHLCFVCVISASDLGTLVSRNATVTGSSQYNEFFALSNIVDGNNSTNGDECHCCAATSESWNPWITVDLGRLYRIRTVELFPRTEKGQYFAGLKIKVHDKLDYGQSTIKVTNTVPLTEHRHYKLTFDNPVVIRYVTLQIYNRWQLLVMCEIKIYSADCPSGTFGLHCDEKCGHCLGNMTCDQMTGTCLRCAAGYIGDLCNTECTSGTYGANCSLPCGHCSEKCDAIIGRCTGGCLSGYQGHLCNEKCKSGTYGLNCSLPCGHCSEKCDASTGRCTGGCLSGYQGQLCNEKRHAVKSDSQSGNGSSVMGAAIGSTVAVICVVIVIVSIIIYRRRRVNSGGNGKLFDVIYKSESTRTFPPPAEQDDCDLGIDSPPLYAQVQKQMKKKGNSAIEHDGNTSPAPDHEYYSFVPRRIRVCDLWDYIHKDRDNDYKILHAEFEIVKKCPIYPMTVASSDANIKKNRYRGLYAYDHTRVPLERTTSNESDYINASFIEGFEKKQKFIAAQGPTTAMVDDFWLMVYQQKCSMIIMLTNLFENEERKCIHYWPKKGETKFKEIRVKLLREEEEADYVVRYMELTKENDGQILPVNQYHFKAWPDKDVPDNVWCLVNFWRAVDSAAARVETPIVVHCSAGIGRTGTFIALDNMFYQAQVRGDVSPFEVARQLREQRIKMIQTQDQYIYLHDAIAEALLVGTEPMKASRFDELYTFMNTPDRSHGSRYGSLLKLINDSLNNKTEHQQVETEYSNVATRIDEAGIIQIQIEGCWRATSTAASYIPMVTGSKACVISVSPSNSNVEEFWNLIHQLGIRTIVMATSQEERNYQMCLSLGVTDHLRSGKLTVKLLPDGNSSTTTTFALSTHTGPEELAVKQFKIPDCSKGPRTLSEARVVAALLNPIIDWNSGHSSPGPILIHCSAGSSASGVIAVALNEVIRMRNEGEVINILQSVKTMKKANKAMINKKDDLKFIYDVIWAYIHMDDVYQNVYN